MTTDKKDRIPNAPDKGLIPKLRFPEFKEGWKSATIGLCCSPLEYGMNAAATEYDGANKYIRITDIDENTSRYKYDDIVSPSGELEDRYKVRPNDILFARTGASTGKTYLYNDNDGTLYFAGFLIRGNIKPHFNSRFVFYQTQLKRYWKWVAIMSARSGQPGINSQEYESYELFLPSRTEQDKIADLLELIDQRISTQSRAIEKLQSLMSGITQKVSKHPSIQKTMLSDVLMEQNEKNQKLLPVYSVSVSEGVVNQMEYLGRSFAAKDTSNYNVVHFGDIVYTKSPTGDFPFGIVKRSNIADDVAVSPLYGVYQPSCDDIGVYLHYYFCSSLNAKNYLHKLIQKGAKNTINITNQRFLENEVPIPEPNTLRKYVGLMVSLSKKLEKEKKLLALLQTQKQFLLQEMFI